MQELRQHAGKRARSHAQDNAEPLQRLPSLLSVALQARQQRRDHCIHRTTGPALEQDAERRASRLLAFKTAVFIYNLIQAVRNAVTREQMAESLQMVL